jgi:hypothetical protein
VVFLALVITRLIYNPLDLSWHIMATVNEGSNTPVIPVLGIDATEGDSIMSFFDATSSNLHHIACGLDGNPMEFKTSPGSTSRVDAAAEAQLSELRFPTGVDIEKLVIYVQNLHTATAVSASAPDAFQIKAYINGKNANSGDPTFLGGPIRDNGPAEIFFGGQGRDVHTLLLQVNWSTGLTTTSRGRPPAITRIELWGSVAQGTQPSGS